jgi:hypothetical protein
MAQAGMSRLGLGWAMLSLAGASVSGCANGPGPAPTTAAALPPLHVVPGSLLLPAAPAGPPSHDTCGAAALASLVGKPRSAIPVPVDLSRRRVTCTACPVAPDIRLDRLNILYDAHTGLVTKVTCG